jgi:hypothetical protein
MFEGVDYAVQWFRSFQPFDGNPVILYLFRFNGPYSMADGNALGADNRRAVVPTGAAIEDRAGIMISLGSEEKGR